jgi:hypothetical protein
VIAVVLVRGEVLRGVSALRETVGLRVGAAKRSEPQGRQQAATSAARAQKKSGEAVENRVVGP